MAGEVAASYSKSVTEMRPAPARWQVTKTSHRRVFSESVSLEGSPACPTEPQTQPPDTVSVCFQPALPLQPLSNRDGKITSTKIEKLGKAEIYFSDNENLPCATVFSYWPLLKGWV